MRTETGGLQPESRDALLQELEVRFSSGGIRARKRAKFRSSLGFRFARRSARILHRLADILIAYLLLALFTPLILLAIVVAEKNGGGVRRTQRLGMWGGRFAMYTMEFPKGTLFANSQFMRGLPMLVNVLKGDMSLVGPRPVSPRESLADPQIAWKRFNMRPGVLSLWWLRKRANIAFDSEVSLDLEYVERQSLTGDLGIAARSLALSFFSGEASEVPQMIAFCGVHIDNLTMSDAATRISAMAAEGRAQQVSFVNADCVNKACRRPSYREVLNRADLVLADGIGIRLAGKLLKQTIRENVNGTDMLPYLCATLQDAEQGLYLLGGKPGVADDVAGWIRERYPNLRVVGTRNGFFTPEEEPGVIAAVRALQPAVLLVAMGAPRQDEWIAAHLEELGAGVSIGVGGLFDFYSGRIPRAPAWMRELGLEWLFRFLQEPRRMFRRYFVGNFEFLARVLRARLFGRRKRAQE